MADWIEGAVWEMEHNAIAQAVAFAVIVLGRFALDRWERQRERRSRHRRRKVHDG